MEAESKKKAKYMEGYLELKEASKVITYLTLPSINLYLLDLFKA